MSHIHASKHCWDLLQPRHAAPFNSVVDPTQLHVDFQRNVGKELYLPLLFPNLARVHTQRGNVETRIAEALDARINVFVSIRKHEYDQVGLWLDGLESSFYDRDRQFSQWILGVSGREAC